MLGGLPPNTTATLFLPTSDAGSVKEGTRPAAAVPGVTFVRFDNGRAVYRLASGTFEFTATR